MNGTAFAGRSGKTDIDQSAPRPSFRDLTLLCVDTDHPTLGASALVRSLAILGDVSARLLSPFRPKNLSQAVDWRPLSPFFSFADYSYFMLKGLGEFFTTTHALVVQWDGFVLDAGAWNEGYLEFDYIGAPWPQFTDGHDVGNGGFSLRSRRLVEALLAPDMVLHAPEDICIGRTNRARLEDRGIRFAPTEVAARFSHERGARVAGSTFGFHGLFNFPDVMPTDYAARIASVPSRHLRGRDAIDLGAVLIADRRAGRFRLLARIAQGVLRHGRRGSLRRMIVIWWRAVGRRPSRS